MRDCSLLEAGLEGELIPLNPETANSFVDVVTGIFGLGEFEYYRSHGNEPYTLDHTGRIVGYSDPQKNSDHWGENVFIGFDINEGHLGYKPGMSSSGMLGIPIRDRLNNGTYADYATVKEGEVPIGVYWKVVGENIPGVRLRRYFLLRPESIEQ